MANNGNNLAAEYEEWGIYDCCLSKNAADKAKKRGEKEYPNCDFIIEKFTAHN